MASALGLWKAKRWIDYGLEWEKSLPREVWILTDCRQRRVYASRDQAMHWWQLIMGPMQGRCDFLYEERWCLGNHTLLRGHDEIPIASFNERLRMDVFCDPHARDYWKEDIDQRYALALSHLPPFSWVPSASPTPGVVYVIMAEGTDRIKIGRSLSAQVRLDTLQTACPYPLILLREIPTADTAALEAALHRRYAPYRKHGEWFELTIEAQNELLDREFI